MDHAIFARDCEVEELAREIFIAWNADEEAGISPSAAFINAERFFACRDELRKKIQEERGDILTVPVDPHVLMAALKRVMP